MMDSEAQRHQPAFEQLRACCQALDDKKATQLTVLSMRNCSTVTEYFVIATGTSDPHLRSLTREVIKRLDDLRVETVHTNPTDRSGWAVVDAYDIIVHIFTEPVRKFYNLEGLWRDAEVLGIDNFVDPVPELTGIRY